MGIEMSRIEKVKRSVKSVDAAPKSAKNFDLSKSFGAKKLKDAKKRNSIPKYFYCFNQGLI